jgi:tripartite-type tricarboxylate transporter receptor subunit TctC
MNMKIRVATLAAALALASGAAIAQDGWPARPVRIVVPSSPGGGTDVYARLLAQRLGEQLKQQFLIDNRPGASGNIGTEAVAKAAPDGYTFLVSANAAIAINPALFKSVPFDVDRDFAPVTRGVMAPMVLAANPGVPAKTVGELAALGHLRAGKLVALAVNERTPLLPNVPTLAEAGLPGLQVWTSFSVLAPAEFGAALKREREHWAAFIRGNNIQPEE